MVDRERLIEILRVPLYQRIKAETAEEVADYLIDNDVVPVVYCMYCVNQSECQNAKYLGNHGFCSYGERKE